MVKAEGDGSFEGQFITSHKIKESTWRSMIDEFIASSDKWGRSSVKHNTFTDDAAIEVDFAYANSMIIFKHAFTKASLWLSPDNNAIDSDELEQKM